MNTLELSTLSLERNMNITELSKKEMITTKGGIVITLGIAAGILFVGSAALGFAIGSKIWK